MRLSVVKLIRKDDLGGDLPKWIDRFLDPLNQFIEQVVKAFDRGITFKENFLGSEIARNFTHNSELLINPGSPLRVKGVALIDSQGEIVTGFGWSRKSDGNIGVTVRFASEGSTRKECLLQIQFGR